MTVEVRKNGGPTFPVNQVLSGFLPFVHHTFGGIYRPVEVVSELPALEEPAPAPRLVRQGTQLWREGKPWFCRGVLSWGWFPDCRSPHPSLDAIREEVRKVKEAGFNLVKCCLWLPPHEYLEELERQGLDAWIELPLWDPDPDMNWAQVEQELLRIVRQYRKHPNVVLWTVGCELHSAVSAAQRRRLFELVKAEVGGALVKDNSGGSEMYRADAEEFGDFDDYHPYGEPNQFGNVIRSLRPGPRPARPILFGETNDFDAHRDLPRLRDEAPFWSSANPELNDQGVRWQYDLPRIIAESTLVDDPQRSSRLRASSLRKGAFVRKRNQEAILATPECAGYVLTGLRDTPISTSGFFDDWGQSVYTDDDLLQWNAESCLFLIPFRQPPWIAGGNREGYGDPFHQREGRVHFQIGYRGTSQDSSELHWEILNKTRGAAKFSAPAQQPVLAAHIIAELPPGEYVLRAQAGAAKNEWPFHVHAAWRSEEWQGWTVGGDHQGWFDHMGFATRDADDLILTGPKGKIVFLEGKGTVAKPFWRESVLEFMPSSLWDALGLTEDWEWWLPMTTDRALSLAYVQENAIEPLLKRIDTRTYEEHVLIGKGPDGLVTTLRPYGGLGDCPWGLRNNLAGHAFLKRIRVWFDLH